MLLIHESWNATAASAAAERRTNGIPKTKAADPART
jgi:hypothetical protein